MNFFTGQTLVIIGGTTVLGTIMGCLGQCRSGTCPLTSTWWRGALYGSFIGLLVVPTNLSRS